MDAKQLYLSLDGRISRSTFWLRGFLVFFAISIVVGMIDAGIGANGMLTLPVSLALIFPMVMVYGKRWHDRDKSAWWVLIGLIPIIGAIWVLIENGCLRGTDGPNRFGEDPLSTGAG